MGNVETYLDMEYAWSKEACEGNYKGYKKLVAEGVSFRNNKFTKSDWEQLIAQSKGRAKYEYTRMMNEKFKDGEE